MLKASDWILFEIVDPTRGLYVRPTHRATGSGLCKKAVLSKLSRKKCLFGLTLQSSRFKTNLIFRKENSCFEILLL